MDEYWAALDAAGRRLVLTFCVLATTEQAGFTKVPGEARFQLDVRSVEPENLDLVYAELDRLVPQIEARRGVRFDLGTRLGGKATPMAAEVRDGLARAAVALGVDYRVMASGGGHDAASFAQAGVPAGMLFVRNQNGSHNPDEAMRMEDFAAGCAVMLRWVEGVAG
jgi:N-carbamoyl-L-amino-acid hydrolase